MGKVELLTAVVTVTALSFAKGGIRAATRISAVAGAMNRVPRDQGSSPPCPVQVGNGGMVSHVFTHRVAEKLFPLCCLQSGD